MEVPDDLNRRRLRPSPEIDDGGAPARLDGEQHKGEREGQRHHRTPPMLAQARDVSMAAGRARAGGSRAAVGNRAAAARGRSGAEGRGLLLCGRSGGRKRIEKKRFGMCNRWHCG